jgi:hypothetical protein
MGDQFEMLSPGNACSATFPLNTIRDDYSVTRIVPLTWTQDGLAQSVALPPSAVYPEFGRLIRDQQDNPPESPPANEIVLHLPYKQTWELLGYSRGALLNSISLAPEEETTIEIFTWERVKRTREDVLSTEVESTQEITLTDKDSREVLKELVKDFSFTSSSKAELSVPLPEG